MVPSRALEPMSDRQPTWTYLSNHAHVLVCLAQGPDARLRDIAEATQTLAGDVQQLSRRLHPVGLRTLGLPEAVRQECEAFTRRTEVLVELDEADVAFAAFLMLIIPV